MQVLFISILNSTWDDSPSSCAKKKRCGNIENKDNELIQTRSMIGWRACNDYQKLNNATGKDNFLLPFIETNA